MKRFQNILYVSHGIGEGTEGLIQALTLTRKNDAKLSLLTVYPELPKTHEAYRSVYEKSLEEGVQQRLHESLTVLGVKEPADFSQIMLSGNALAQSVIQFVLRDGTDVLIKEAESGEEGKGFRSIDMELLRNCPCPVWLNRRPVNARAQIKIAVAVDPDTRSSEERDLAIKLLRLSRELADGYSEKLMVISCWEYEFENFLRRNVWGNMPEEDVSKVVQTTQAHHYSLVDALIKESGIGGEIIQQRVRGIPDEAIPKVVERNKVDILVMGTIGRTGIPGFIIGNTAENIVQSLQCSLLALKPAGYVSPVKAYD